MKKLIAINYYLLPFLLAGCSTSVITGKKKVLGLIPIPFTGTRATGTPPTSEAMAFAQLAPLVWAAIPLVIVGVLWWKLSGGSTGLGKLSVGLGLLFITIAVVFPTIIGYLGAIVIISLVLAIGYAVWYQFKKR